MSEWSPAVWRLLASAMLIPLLGLTQDFMSGGLGAILGPVIHSVTGLEDGVIPNLFVATFIAGIFAANLFALATLSFRLQVIVAWIELMVLFLAFFASFNLSYAFIAKKLDMLVIGAGMTVFISLVSIFFATILALLGALARLSKNGLAFGISTFYISFFRGTPLLLQVYVLYLGLPQVDFVLDAIPAGIVALSLCYGAYMAEIFRAGIQSVPAGQWEAATAIGLRPTLVFRLVVLPQAIKIVTPAIGNQFIAMLKDSSLVSVLGVWELMFMARTLGRSEWRHLEMLVSAALIYWIISGIFEIIQSRIEHRYKTGDERS